MSDYPKTDEDWVNLAECIVTKIDYPSPEEVGELSVEATTTIFSWYKGAERQTIVARRDAARKRMIELGVQAGCLQARQLPELGHPDPMKQYALYDTSTSKTTILAIQDELRLDGHYGYIDESGGVYALYIEVPQERERAEYEEVLDRISQPLTQPEEQLRRPFPSTDGDWIDLAEDIKDKLARVASPDYYTATHQLGIILTLEEGNPEDAKRWLVEKAGELGIS